MADAFGLKADPKKSEIKDFFTSIATKLEGTIDKLSKLPKENGNSENKSGKEGDLDNTNNDIAKAINGTIETLKKMIEAAKKIAKATDGSEVKIGEVGTANNKGAAADQESVNGIADGMKEIVDAGGKDALKAGAAAGGADNKEAGKLFGGANGNAGANDNDIGKAAAAVNAVSGEQILKAIVDAAAGGDKVGAAAGAATNPIAAAIGTDAQGADFAGGGMNNSSEKIAAAIVLRGMAKDGKFSLAAHNDANQKAKVKSVVHQGTSKTILALTNLIQKVAEEGLTTVAKAVKAVSTNGGPTPKKSN